MGVGFAVEAAGWNYGGCFRIVNRAEAKAQAGGKELTGKSVGDQVKIVPMDGDKKKVYTITKIEAAF